MLFCALPRPAVPATGQPLPFLVPRLWPIAATVLAFILWWPLGLLALLLWKGGEAMGFQWRTKGRDAARAFSLPGRSSGNAAFDDYRDGVLRRLEEERRALDEQQRRFAEFLEQLKRAKDREEFDRFMQSGGGQNPGPGAG